MEKEALLTLALTKIKGLNPRHALELYQAAGTATALFDNIEALESGGEPLKLSVAKLLREGLADALAQAEREAKFCEKHSIAVLTQNDANYPVRLRESDSAPLALFYCGTANINAPHVVSIVGTRRCTEYGKDLCAAIGRDLAALLPDTLVVSGLAYGIDINAHRAALNNGLPTVGVLAHGMDRIYPAHHRADAAAMVSRGGLITEYFSGTTPVPGNFVRRNRIIAGMCDACIVVESAYRGGAIITARLAFDYNREVFACPGRVGDQFSEGCNRIIESQTAHCFTSVDNLLYAMQWASQQEIGARRAEGVQPQFFPNLTPEQQRIVTALQGSEGRQINELSLELDMRIQDLSSALFELELQGIVRPLPGGVYRLVN